MTKPAYKRWYHTKRWERRSLLHRKHSPVCVSCKANGIVKEANVADHVVPHRGDPISFWFGELQSLCYDCHNNSKQQIERKGFVNDIGLDGWPVDPKHYANTNRYVDQSKASHGLDRRLPLGCKGGGDNL